MRRADQLPLLQYCLNRMWMRGRDPAGGEPTALKLADYASIGGLDGALNAQADDVLRALGEARAPVAEVVFRALTQGATVADAVRRPTRFGERVAICGGDEAAVRAVVDAFRAPGCNFLAPEFDPRRPELLDARTFVDISHESLIRQWKKLPEWLEKEARAARQWRRLNDHFEDSEPIRGTELANMVAWRNAERPNAAWAARYGGDYRDIIKFLEDSELRRRRFAPVIMPLFGLAVLSISLIFGIGILFSIFGSSQRSQWLLFYVGIYSESAAVVYGFALWHYCRHPLKRAALAGAAIGVLNVAAAAAFMGVVSSDDATLLPAMRVYYATLSPPLTLTVLAISEPIFRRLFAWLLLIGLSVGLYGLLVWLYYSSRISISDGIMELAGYALSIVGLAAFGYLLRRGAR